MYDRNQMCRELTDVLLASGYYGRKLKVSFDERLQAWRVNYTREGRGAMIFLEEEEVERCLSGKACFTMGLLDCDQQRKMSSTL
jgi:hypothetical protein